MSNPAEHIQSGEAGHRGPDRQANKHPATSHQAPPDEKQAASSSQAQSRSARARTGPTPHDSPDALHPSSANHPDNRNRIDPTHISAGTEAYTPGKDSSSANP
jgi:hypothetical protein